MGGKVRVVMRRPDGTEAGAQGEYTLIDRPRRLVMNWTFDDDPSNEQLIELSFSEAEGSTTVLMVNSGISTDERRDGQDRGWRGVPRRAGACTSLVTMTADSPSELIDARIVELGDWRGETLARIRDLIREADPEVVEEWKWKGTPVWEHDGIICTGETYKNYVKTTFAKGASLDDPSGLFNSSLAGNTRRAIDFHEGEEIDEEAFRALIREAVAANER